jgi:DnaJ family protein C protein 7
MLGQPRQALEDSKTATSLDPLFIKAWSRLVKCSIMLGDTVTARQANQKAGSPQDQDLKNLEVLERFKEETMNALNNKDYRRALYCLDKCLEIATHSLPLKATRAECLAFVGRYAEAQEAAPTVCSASTA